MADGRTRRMHTVPEGYFESFAMKEPERRVSRVWRFDRVSVDSKILGVGNAEVAKDIYTVLSDEGTPDTGIEEVFCGLEGAFYNARNDLLGRMTPSKENWSALFRFVAAQLLRTPRFFQLMRDDLDVDGPSHEQDTLPRVMLLLINRWMPRLARMSGILGYNETSLPLLTSDNPAVMWKKNGDGFICGVDQYDPELVVSCALSPTLMFIAYQTPESLGAVLSEPYDVSADPKPQQFGSDVHFGPMLEGDLKRMNHICVSNAHRYVYASYCDKSLLRFLENRFFGAPAPVRRSDLRPIGSPIDHTQAG